MDADQQKLVSTIRQIFGGVAWTHKTHEKDREIYAARVKRDKWINAILISSSTVFLVLGIILDKDPAIIIGTISAFGSTLFAVYTLSFSPEKEAQYHRETAKALLAERNCLLLLMERSMASDANLSQIRKELETATARINNINSLAPGTSTKAYLKASHALSVGQELTFSAEEIDNLLPTKLRSVKP